MSRGFSAAFCLILAVWLPAVASGRGNAAPVVQNDVAETYHAPALIDVLANAMPTARHSAPAWWQVLVWP